MGCILGYKKGMMQLFAENGKVIPVTIVSAKNVIVSGKKEKDKDGYEAVVLGIGKSKKNLLSQKIKFKKIGFVPRFEREFSLNLLRSDLAKVGTKISVDQFSENDFVSVQGVTKGKGFQGVVKRWGFHGGHKSATHGNSDKLRGPGAIGAGTRPGRILKGKKMAGRMGGDIKTITGLKIVKVDKEKGLLFIKGGVPGGKNSLLKIYKKD